MQYKTHVCASFTQVLREEEANLATLNARIIELQAAAEAAAVSAANSKAAQRTAAVAQEAQARLSLHSGTFRLAICPNPNPCLSPSALLKG